MIPPKSRETKMFTKADFRYDKVRVSMSRLCFHGHKISAIWNWLFRTCSWMLSAALPNILVANWIWPKSIYT